MLSLAFALRTVITALFLGLVWIGLAAAAMLPGRIETAAILRPSPELLAALPDTVAIIGATRHLLIVRSDDPEFTRKLYSAGASLVLPARSRTCLDISVMVNQSGRY